MKELRTYIIQFEIPGDENGQGKIQNMFYRFYLSCMLQSVNCETVERSHEWNTGDGNLKYHISHIIQYDETGYDESVGEQALRLFLNHAARSLEAKIYNGLYYDFKRLTDNKYEISLLYQGESYPLTVNITPFTSNK